MLSTGSIYLLAAATLFIIGAEGLMSRGHLLRKVLALNVCTSGVFLLIVTLGRAGEPVDPIPHAMVLTGIVVALSTTAVALGLIVRLQRQREP
jgi:multicomponent Na+:H+ antiporter subunit C